MQPPQKQIQATELSRKPTTSLTNNFASNTLYEEGGGAEQSFGNKEPTASLISAPPLNSALRFFTFTALVLLMLLCIAWELWIDPLVAGGSIYFLKALPLLFALYGVFKGNLYTMQWSSMLVLLYVLEGVVRGYSDVSEISRCLGRLEFSLAMMAFLCAIFYVRPAKKWAKAQKK